LAIFTSLAYFATGRSILGPIIVHYVFNTCSTMLNTAFLGQPRYRHRDVNEMVLVSAIGVALLTVAATRGKFGQGRSDRRISS
jgi:membrane protease YdiL (CAAX protease family)